MYSCPSTPGMYGPGLKTNECISGSAIRKCVSTFLVTISNGCQEIENCNWHW